MKPDTLIKDSHLPARIKNLCRDHPYLGATLSELARHTPSELLRWRRVGVGTLEKTKTVLAQAGLTLSDS